MRPASRGQRGIAMILIVWVVTLLLVLASSFLYATRVDVSAMRNTAAMARAEAIALAAVERVMLEIQKPQASPGVWARNALPREWRFEEAFVRITLSDESGKIDLNSANDQLLQSLLKSAGLGAEESARVLDAILDWRDADSFRRPNGAEERDYSEAGLGWSPANQPFQSIQELSLVLGVTPQLFRRIAPMITVYSRQPGVNPHFASRSALLAIPNVTEELVDSYLSERELAIQGGGQPPVFPAAGPFASYARSSSVSIVVEVSLPGAGSVSREAVAVSTPQFPRRPYALLHWREVFAKGDQERSPWGTDGR